MTFVRVRFRGFISNTLAVKDRPNLNGPCPPLIDSDNLPAVDREMEATEMTNGKDSAEVVEFLTLYSRLKDWCDDEPDAIFQLAISDKKFKDVCIEVLNAAERLHASEQRHRHLFAAPVDPKFLLAWRDFEARYEHILVANWITFVFNNEGAIVSDKSQRSTSAVLKWENADLNAKIAADLIEKVIGYARVQAFDDKEALDPDYSMSAEEAVEMAIDYWEGLTDEIGFNLADVFRRRRLVPFVFFPRHIAARHGLSEKTSIYQSLQQAHDAFIFGVPFAALALMRSIMETVLRYHYDAQGNDLSERINSVRRFLPTGANEASLHRLRKLANAVLHGSADSGEMLKLEPHQLEREILSLLFVLRALIEGVPQWRPR